MSEDCTGQSGIIKHIGSGELHVEIMNRSSCSNCHAKSACLVMDEKAKMIVVQGEGDYKIGDTIMVKIDNKLGLKAVFFGYFFPFLLVVALLVGLILIGMSEIGAGMISLAILPVYYLILYLLRDKLKNKFSLRIQS